jgi:phage terminase large subunit
VDKLLRQGETPTDSIVVKANWSDNPWFPSVLEQERQDSLNNDPDNYDHIWEGGYMTVTDGAYYAKAIAQAKRDGRIGYHVAADPYMTIKLFCDIGGTGAKSDAFSIWAVQFIGDRILMLDYYEAVGQDISTHLAWMRERDYIPGKAEIWLPHDGGTSDKVYSVSYESAFKDVGYNVDVIPNQGRGAAKQRIEAGRRLFPKMSFDKKCDGGIDALSWYHEKKDDIRQIGLGPEHDWSSHAADAFGYMCVAYKPPTTNWKPLKAKKRSIA